MNNLLAEAVKINGMSEDEFFKAISNSYAEITSTNLNENGEAIRQTFKFDDYKIVITAVRHGLDGVVK